MDPIQAQLYKSDYDYESSDFWIYDQKWYHAEIDGRSVHIWVCESNSKRSNNYEIEVKISPCVEGKCMSREAPISIDSSSGRVWPKIEQAWNKFLNDHASRVA